LLAGIEDNRVTAASKYSVTEAQQIQVLGYLRHHNKCPSSSAYHPLKESRCFFRVHGPTIGEAVPEFVDKMQKHLEMTFDESKASLACSKILRNIAELQESQEACRSKSLRDFFPHCF